MRHITRYSKRIKNILLTTTTATCIFCLFFIPFFENRTLATNVGYYTVVLNGEELGAVNSPEEATQALANARLKLSNEADSILYMDPEFEVYEQSKFIGTRMSEADIEESIYNNLASSIVDVDTQTAYTVRINDFTVTVGSKDDVVKLIEGAKKNYDDNNEFQVNLVADESGSNQFSVDIVKSGIASNDNDIVAATLNGDAVQAVTEGEAQADGLTDISFSQNVVVNETAATEENVLSVEDALAQITKEREEKTVYVVEVGDTISGIASKNDLKTANVYELNEGLTENSVIMPGDEIIITVPTPELSVVTTERVTYEEDYEADIQYVDNDTMYRGTSKVIQSGTSGHRKVVADVTYVNGTESGREYIQQTIIEESIPRIVEVGTATPPTYVKPIYGGTFTSGFAYRWGKLHQGVDWSCSQGTSVMATADGTVVRAGWYGGYGYCVEIQHSNGVLSRYGHLSSISVSVGQKVSQYEVVAKSGNTGDSTGPHIHFEIRINGTAVNPLNYVNKY